VFWLKLELYCKESDIVFIEEILENFEPLSLSIEPSNDSEFFETDVNEYPIWDEVRLSIIFPSDIDQRIREKLTTCFQIFKPNFSQMQNEDWVKVYHMKNKPIFIGEKVCICPSWENDKKIDRPIIIRLDPGQAFGSGSHETTQLCIEYLEKIDLEGKTLLDYGSGSGILGIAAVKLGAEKVICIDNDKNSLKVSFVNAKKNNTLRQMQIDLKVNKTTTTDIVVSNIFSSVLTNLVQDFAFLLRPGGILILSGILKTQLDEFLKNFKNSFDVINLNFKNEWCLVVLKKQFINNACNR